MVSSAPKASKWSFLVSCSVVWVRCGLKHLKAFPLTEYSLHVAYRLKCILLNILKLIIKYKKRKDFIVQLQPVRNLYLSHFVFPVMPPDLCIIPIHWCQVWLYLKVTPHWWRESDISSNKTFKSSPTDVLKSGDCVDCKVCWCSFKKHRRYDGGSHGGEPETLCLSVWEQLNVWSRWW